VIERLTGDIGQGKQIDQYRITGFAVATNGQGG